MLALLLLASIAGSQDFELKRLSSDGAWVLYEDEEECLISADYNDGTILIVAYDAHKETATLSLSNKVYAGIKERLRYPLELTFSRSGQVARKWTDVGFYGSGESRLIFAHFSDEILDDIARSDGVDVRRPEALVASLGLKGSAVSVTKLRQCAYRVMRERPRDPFADEGETPADTPQARNSPQSWITNDDYPADALKSKPSGTVGFRLQVGKDGNVEDCAVTQSSGAAQLDDRTCELLKRRARFYPAQDASGSPIPSIFEQRFTWRLPAGL